MFIEDALIKKSMFVTLQLVSNCFLSVLKGLKIVFRPLYALILVFLVNANSFEGNYSKILEEIKKNEKKPVKDEIMLLANHLLEDIEKNSLSVKSNEELNDGYIAFRKASLYFPDEEKFTLAMKKFFYERYKRNLTSDEDKEDMFYHFLESRMFKEADIFCQEFKLKCEELPKKVKSKNSHKTKGRVIELMSKNINEIIVKNIDFEKGSKVVIVFSPTCSVTLRALSKIVSDERISKIFRVNSIFLTRKYLPMELLNFKNEHKMENVYIVFKSSDFPDFYFYFYPHFYFIKNGKILYEFKGWDDEDKSIGNVYMGLEKIGLLKSEKRK